jgi:hypothetical protein
MAKSIENFLPEYDDQRRIQVDIGATLHGEANRLRLARRLKWSQVITACLAKFVEDLEPSEQEDPSRVSQIKRTKPAAQVDFLDHG